MNLKSYMFGAKQRLVTCAFIGFAACATLTGCATREMTPTQVTIANRFNKTVSLAAHSDVEALPGLTLRGDAVGSALKATVEKYGPFSKVVAAEKPDYMLEVRETYASTPPIFFITVTSEVQTLWQLKESSNDKVVWKDSITGKHTAHFFDSLFSWIGAVRMRHANTGAVSDYLKTGVERISALSL